MKGKYMTDSSFVGSPEFLFILNEHGAKGLAAKMVLESMLWQQDDCTYPLSSIFKLAPMCGVSALELKDIIDCFITIEIFGSDGDVFWSKAINQEKENVETKAQKARDAVNARYPRKNDSPTPVYDRNTAVVRENTTTGVGICVGVSEDLKNNGVEIIPGYWLDDISRETTVMSYLRAGLTADDLAAGAQFAKDHYKSTDPANLRKPWVIQELQREKTNAERLKKSQAPPLLKKEMTGPEIVKYAREQREKEKLQ